MAKNKADRTPKRMNKMIRCIRTNSGNLDFQNLVRELDADLSIRDGEDHAFYAQFNKIDTIKYSVVALDDGKAVGCGALKEYSPGTAEVKRMYVLQDWRGLGIASLILNQLELWAIELNYTKCILETGLKQPEAIALYKKNGYTITPNYGQYIDVTNSVCFEKVLTKGE